MDESRTALVLSAGGMFGAYQAGTWKGLSSRMRPAAVIGASAGALNAWAIAGGIDPADLARMWLDPGCAELAILRPAWHNCALHERIRRLYRAFRPQTEIGIIAVDLRSLRPRLFRDSEIQWQHLAASCAVLFCYPQVRIAGRWYTDGGLLGALPLWAAPVMNASDAVAVNVLSQSPSPLLATAVRAFRALAPKTPEAPESFPVSRIEPSRALGPLSAALFWERRRIEQWIRLGEADALQCP